MNKRTKHVEITIKVTLPTAMLRHMSAVLQSPTREALAFAVEDLFGEVDIEHLEPALLNRAYASEEQAVLGLNEYCARVGRKRWPNHPDRVRAHWTRQMIESYRVRCTEEGWGVEPAVGATFLD